MSKTKEKFYKITSTCKEDMREVFKNQPEQLKKIEQLTDAQMEYIAEKMASDYLNQLYWGSLEIITETVLETMKVKDTEFTFR